MIAAMSRLELVGRSSSHFTRVPRIFAHELGLALVLRPVLDMTRIDAAAYADNPARKLPSLLLAGGPVFGAENICRTLVELCDPIPPVVWPEQLRSAVARNAQELVWHAMAAEVQVLMGALADLPADNLFFAKGRAGFTGALAWLDAHLDAALATLPDPPRLSLLEVTALCLVEHIAFRGTLSLAPYPALRAFADAHGQRPSARATAYAFDAGADADAS